MGFSPSSDPALLRFMELIGGPGQLGGVLKLAPPTPQVASVLPGGTPTVNQYVVAYQKMLNDVRASEGLPPLDFSNANPGDAGQASSSGTGGGSNAPGGGATGISAGSPNPVTTDIAGRTLSGSAILPGIVPTVNPALTKAWNDFLSQNVGKGLNPYPGPLNPDMSQTVIPQATSAASNLLQTNPLLANMMQYGGQGGPGNFGESYTMQYGSPSQVGQWLHNMAQTGVSSPGAGGPLLGLAAGNLGGSAQYLAPFLTRQLAPYSAPRIGG